MPSAGNQRNDISNKRYGEGYADRVSARGPGQVPESVIVWAGVNRIAAGIFGFLILLWGGLLLGIEIHGPPTVGDRIAAAVIFGFLLLLSVGGWMLNRRHRGHLEIRHIDIVSRPLVRDRSRRLRPQRVDRADGDSLRILPRYKLYGRVRPPRLVFLGRGEFIVLQQPLEGAFSLEEVQRACEAHGWPFDGDSSRAVRDVQAWLHHGQTVEAAQLLELFGPFPATATEGEPHIALTAAVFEDVGDKLMHRNRGNARDAYRRAAIAQRAFAGYARSPDQAAARLAEASRIEGKAEA
jgi:hypothetical protein